MNKTDVAGARFGRLTAIEPTDLRVAKKIMWKCVCDCGKTTFANARQLKEGRRNSCGCAKTAGNQINKHPGRHGHYAGGKPTPTYRVWGSMLSRCRNKNAQFWSHYGGRGIKVCERWLSFENFLADMGEKPVDLSLDRTNNDGDYCPENCRWATDLEQHRNRSDNKYLEFNGEKKSVAEWADSIGMNRSTFTDRVGRRGWPIEKALTTPLQTSAELIAVVNQRRWGNKG